MVDQVRAPQASKDRLREARAATLVGVALTAGAAVGLVLSFFTLVQAAVLFGWDVTAALYLGWIWSGVRHLDSAGTERFARREDPSRPVADLVIVLAGVAMLGAFGLDLLKAGSTTGGTKAYLVAGGVLSVVLSWFVVHSVFVLRYARAYFAAGGRPIDFNEDDPPVFSDFAYFGFTIAMTFQVSDTDIRDKGIRRTALHQMLLAYLLGAVIIAAAINVVAQLLSS